MINADMKLVYTGVDIIEDSITNLLRKQANYKKDNVFIKGEVCEVGRYVT